jgi:hypothetical protein
VVAHSNCIEVFPEVMQLPEIKVCRLIPWILGFKSVKRVDFPNLLIQDVCTFVEFYTENRFPVVFSPFSTLGQQR